MINAGCTILLGTDNVMFVQPDMFQEMAFIETIYRLPPLLILRAAIEGARWAGNPWYITKGAPARFFCVNASTGLLPFSRDPCTTFIKRVNGGEILENVLTEGHE
jgi:cytosine/adenosine deaminase-related metal-dependent hydrolase